MRIDHDAPADPSAYAFAHEVRTRFAETDAMAIVHHAAYLPYLEEARIAWMRSLDLPYAERRTTDGDVAVLEVQVSYRRPLRFDDVVAVHVRLAGGSRAWFALDYLLVVGDEVRATAVTVHAHVDERGRPRRQPEWLRDLVAGTG